MRPNRNATFEQPSAFGGALCVCARVRVLDEVSELSSWRSLGDCLLSGHGRRRRRAPARRSRRRLRRPSRVLSAPTDIRVSDYSLAARVVS